MKKISLAVLLIFTHLAALFGQEDTATYANRKLKLSEVNLVSGYYIQDGNNSAVTGGVGTEHLTDFANNLEIRFIKTDKKQRTHTWSFDMGIDHYTSASSDKIDPSTISSASSADTRFYPSLNWSVKDEVKNYSAGAGLYYSKEYDYISYGLGLNFSKNSKDNNREFAAHLMVYWDTWKVVLPIELRNGPGKDEHNEARNSYSGSFTYSQVVNPRLQLAVILDLIYQQGLLATKYQRVYFSDMTEKSETLPDTRFKLPIGLRLHYFLADRYILRGFLRYYNDNWGINGYTAELEVPIKISPFFSLSPFYRFYTQTAAQYFAPYAFHAPGDGYFTSDYDLSAFNSQFFGSGIRWVPENGILRMKHFTSLELRYGHYLRSNGLTSDIVTASLGFK